MILLNNHPVEFTTFPNNERRLDVNTEHLLDDNIVIWHYKDDSSIFELLLFNKSMTQLEETYELVIAYMPYSRMDRVQEDATAFSLEMLVSILGNQLTYVTNIYIFDPHSPVTLKQFKSHNLPACELPCSLAESVFSENQVDLEDTWVVFPDKGAAKRYNFNAYPNVIICEKTRDFATGQITGMSAKIHKMTGKLGRATKLVIVDDLCSYGGTFVRALAAVKENPYVAFKEAWLIVSHAEEAIAKGNVLKEFDKVFTTDSIYSAEFKSELQDKITITPIADIVKSLNF